MGTAATNRKRTTKSAVLSTSVANALETWSDSTPTRGRGKVIPANARNLKDAAPGFPIQDPTSTLKGEAFKDLLLLNSLSESTDLLIWSNGWTHEWPRLSFGMVKGLYTPKANVDADGKVINRHHSMLGVAIAHQRMWTNGDGLNWLDTNLEIMGYPALIDGVKSKSGLVIGRYALANKVIPFIEGADEGIEQELLESLQSNSTDKLEVNQTAQSICKDASEWVQLTFNGQELVAA